MEMEDTFIFSALPKPVEQMEEKSKLFGVANPGSWEGFGKAKEKLQIRQGDVSITKGSDGPVMHLSTDLKNQLNKP
ncbi:hypothetical protein ACOSQ3_002658 [Xanthoceras sorbifolium]